MLLILFAENSMTRHETLIAKIFETEYSLKKARFMYIDFLQLFVLSQQ